MTTLLLDLKQDSIGLQWHEAVALVLDIAEALDGAGRASCPLIDHLALAKDGSTLQLPGARFADNPVLGLGEILSELLESTSAPKPLAELVALAVKAPESKTLDAFVGELKFFERPDRRAHLVALASRAGAAGSARASADALDQLQKRARERAGKKPARTSAQPPAASRRPFFWRAVTLVSGVLVIAEIAIFFWIRPGHIPEVALPALSWLKTHAAAVLPSLPPPVEASVEKPIEKPVEKLDKPTPVRRVRRAATDEVPTPQPTTLDIVQDNRGSESQPEYDLANNALDGQPSEPDVPSPDTVDRFTEGLGPVYSVSQLEVKPARLVHRQLPSNPSPGLRLDEAGEFDLVVNEHGAVERVRLVSEQNRFHERMLVAAAKAWRFEPAMLDGTPVKYRTQIRITQ